MPEQASLISNAPAGTVNGVDLGATLAQCDGTTNSLPIAKLSDYTTCIPAALAYDEVKVQSILNEIDGKSSDGSRRAPVPTVFGMNFQAVSVGEKLTVAVIWMPRARRAQSSRSPSDTSTPPSGGSSRSSPSSTSLTRRSSS